MMIPGVSYFSSVLILGEIGDIDRVTRAKERASYADQDFVVREMEAPFELKEGTIE